MAELFDSTPIKYNTEKWWSGQIKQSLEYRKKHSKEHRWDDIEDYWNHDGEAFEEGSPSFNMVYMYGRSLIPSVMLKRPSLINTPRSRGFDYALKNLYMPLASIYDSIDAYLMDEMEGEDLFKDAVLNAYLYNIAPIETGYDFPDFPSAGEDFFRDSFLNQAGLSQKEGVIDRARGSNRPWLDLIPARQYIQDTTNSSQRKNSWYAKAMYVPTRLLKKDKTLKRSAIKSTHVPEQLFTRQYTDMLTSQAGLEPYTLIYEIHEAQEGTMTWMTANDEFLFDPVEDPLQIDGLPVELLTFNRNPNSIWGTPDALYIEPQMHDGNETRRLGLLQRRLSLLKIITSGAMDESEVEKIFDEGISVLRMEDLPANARLSEQIQILQPHVQTELFAYQEKLLEDGNRLLGFGANQQGTFAPGRRTKFEAQTVAFQNDIRVDERRHMLSNVISRTFAKVNMLVTRYWTDPMLMRVIGVDGARYFVQVRPQDLKAEMDVSIDVESLQPRNRDREKEEMIQVMQILAQVPNVNIFPLIRQMLSGFAWSDIDAYLPQGQQDQAFTQEQFLQQQSGLIENGPAGGGNLGSLAKTNLTPLVQGRG